MERHTCWSSNCGVQLWLFASMCLRQGFQLLEIAWREKQRARSARTHEWGPGPPSTYYKSPGGVASRGKALDRGEGPKAAPPCIKKTLHLRISKCKISGPFPRGGTRIIFWRGVRPEVWNPYPYLRIFLPQKTADLKLFFEIFANRDPFLRVFLPQNGWFYHFFAIFAKWDPLLRIFLTKMGPMSKDFCWKSNPFGRHIPVCLNMWVPPPPALFQSKLNFGELKMLYFKPFLSLNFQVWFWVLYASLSKKILHFAT